MKAAISRLHALATTCAKWPSPKADKVAAQIKFGYSVNGYAMGDLEKSVLAVSDADVAALVEEYDATYRFTGETQHGGAKRKHVVDAARIELGIKNFLVRGGFGAFTTTFENLYGISQLPGLACQRLMQQGFGFSAEGDWKTSALLRTMKVMSYGQAGGTSFMEGLHLRLHTGNELVIGSHMLEVCPSIATDEKPLLDVQYLGIGRKDDPARLIFEAKPGPALNASLIDMGDRFRLIVNEVEAIKQPKALPKLPVARVVWKALPNLAVAAEAWILAGGAHHYGLLASGHLRAAAHVCRNLRYRVPADRRKDRNPGIQERNRLERVRFRPAPLSLSTRR